MWKSKSVSVTNKVRPDNSTDLSSCENFNGSESDKLSYTRRPSYDSFKKGCSFNLDYNATDEDEYDALSASTQSRRSSLSSAVGNSPYNSPNLNYGKKSSPLKIYSNIGISTSSLSLSSLYSSSSLRTPKSSSLLFFNLATPKSIEEMITKVAEHENIKICTLPYHQLSNGAYEVDFKKLDIDETEITHISHDWFDKVRSIAISGAVVISARLGKIQYPQNRRISFEHKNITVADPKETFISTKTNENRLVGRGHLPRETCFLATNNPYILTDNNFAGDFPQICKDKTDDLNTLQILQSYMSENIKHVRWFGNQICIAEEVNKFTKHKVDGNTKYVATGEKHLKHFIQEAETIAAIISHIEDDGYTFLYADNQRLEFKSPDGITFLVEFRLLMPEVSLTEAAICFKDIEAFKRYAEDNWWLPSHAPIYYMRNGMAVPFLVQSGRNGFPITSDVDLMHIGINHCLPAFTCKAFGGLSTDPQCFLAGMNLFSLYLKSNTFADFIKNYSAKLKKYNKDIVKIYSDLIKSESSYKFELCKKSNFIMEDLQTTLEQTIIKYSNAPLELQTVGYSSIYSLLMVNHINHPLTVHGTENQNPSNRLPEFGATIICDNNGDFYLAADENSYTAFMLHGDILSKQIIDPHPCWLDSNHGNDNLSQRWLDMLKISALYEVINSPNEKLESVLAQFQHRVECLMSIGRESEYDSISLIKDAINNLQRELATSTAKNILDKIYMQYDALINAVEQQIKKSNNLYSPRSKFNN